MTGCRQPHSPHSPRSESRQNAQGRRGKRRAGQAPSDICDGGEPAQSLDAPGSSKVAIPRLHSEDMAVHDARAREAAKIDRTNHACEPCRTRKTKCSGERPTCKHCRQFNISCVYADGKRDRVKRHQENLERKIALYESLLTEAGSSIGPSVWARFERARAHVEDDDMDIPETGGENIRAASEGSMDAVDSIAEDVTRSAEAQRTGFIGKSSDLNWQRNLNRKENDMSGFIPGHQNPSDPRKRGPEVSSLSYQTHYTALMTEVEDPHLDVYEVPLLGTAHQLVEGFYRTVYPSFPFLPRINFEMQLNKAYRGNFEGNARPNDRWRAILNLVFAIGARQLRATEDSAAPDRTVHETFFARGARLGLTGKAILDGPDLQQVQIFALASFHLTTVNHINQAWVIAGNAVRGAVALGLQVENKTEALNEYAKESRYRLWWAVFGLETLLQVMTGRPGAISMKGYSTPLPVPYDEANYDPAGRSHQRLSMARFTQGSYRHGNVPSTDHPNINTEAPIEKNKVVSGVPAEALDSVQILDTFYQPAASNQVWAQVQIGIQKYNDSLDDWQSSLPTALSSHIAQNDTWHDNRDHLGVLFYSAKIITNRPCLCEMVEMQPTETAASQKFNRRSAGLCIEAARDILRMLPREYRIKQLARTCSWWAMIHYIFSAVTVLTIALFYECRHIGKSHQPTIVQEAEHGLNWLRALAEEPDEGAERAWRIASTTFQRITRRLGLRTNTWPDPRTDDNQRRQAQQGSPIATISEAAVGSVGNMDSAYGFEFTGGPKPLDAYQGLSLDTEDWQAKPPGLDYMFGSFFSSYTSPQGYFGTDSPKSGTTQAMSNYPSAPSAYPRLDPEDPYVTHPVQPQSLPYMGTQASIHDPGHESYDDPLTGMRLSGDGS